MKKRRLIVVLCLVVTTLLSCNSSDKELNKTPLISIWAHDGILKDKSDVEVSKYFKHLKNIHIEAVYISGDIEFYKRIVPIAKKEGVAIHAWRWTMNSRHFLKTHPEYYAVNKKGESCSDKPPYVDYYRWMCPRRDSVKIFVIDQYKELAKIEDLASVHLDYVRYCDIFLPVGLLPNYNLTQETEMPEFDYCYCDLCVKSAKEELGIDPFNIKDSTEKEKWDKFRLDAVVSLVNDLVAEVKKVDVNMLVSGAVFPTPEMSKAMVRQDWGRFRLDLVCPMIYNGFYLENIDWVGSCVKECQTMEIKKPVFAGLFLGDLQSGDSLYKAMKVALDNGAHGIVLFEQLYDNQSQIKAVSQIYKEYSKESAK